MVHFLAADWYTFKLQYTRNLDFTQKCQQGAKRENIGLIKTADLFYVCKYLTENTDVEFAKKCREAIFNQLGVIVKFPL